MPCTKCRQAPKRRSKGKRNRRQISRQGEIPAPECINYDPNNPPPGWPVDFVPWTGRGDIPPELRCNLTPPLVNISAREAFHAYQKQSLQGGKRVMFIDVRTYAETRYVGSPAQVNSITLKCGKVIVPDGFCAKLESKDGRQYLKVYCRGRRKYIPVSDVAKTDLSAISFTVPVEFHDAKTGKKTLNPLFGFQIDGLIKTYQPDRIIFFCRSGQRSSIGCYYQYCPFQELFPGVLSGKIIAYEVESDVENGFGGFESTTYSNSFLGYRGYPGRNTADIGSVESVSFKDQKLPIITNQVPKVIDVDPQTGAVLHVDTLDAEPWANRVYYKR